MALTVFDKTQTPLLLPLSGGTMAGPIAMGGSKITGLQNGSASGDAVGFGQLKMDLIGSAAAVSSASIDFVGIPVGLYSYFIITGLNVIPGTHNVHFLMRTSTGGAFQATGYSHQTMRFTSSGSGFNGLNNDTSFNISGNAETIGTGANQTWCFEVTLYNTLTNPQLKYANWKWNGLMASASYISGFGGGEVNSASAEIDGIRLLVSSGVIASGWFFVYGIRRA